MMRWAWAAALLIALAPSAFAQNANRPQVERTGLQCTGTVKEVGAGVFQLQAEDGEQWLVKVEARPEDITYSGSADASFLRPGLFVRLSSKLNRRGQTEDKISSLTVITPKADSLPGLKTEASNSAADGLFADSKVEKRSKPKPAAGGDATYEIIGRIAKVTPSELTIDAAGTPVRAQLADKVSVSLEVADLSYLRPGDKVELSGWYVAGQKGRASGTRIVATAAESLNAAVPMGKKPKAAGSK